MEHEKYSYVEALKWLAKRYNIEVEETEVSPEKKLEQQVSESLLIINQFAQEFYASQLWLTEDGKDIGLGYMMERGFTEEVLKKFQVGFAPDKKDLFAKEAIEKKYNPELLVKAGLIVERNEQFFDNYRDRIIFPIHNNSGRVIGFGARQIKKNDRSPKYINTPENELYVKSKILYGTYFARHAIDKADECLLVEGYTDVISLHQAGIENVVASGGTALTREQLRLIKKYSKNLTIIYDGDAAGIKAATRGLDMALEESLSVKLVLIPGNEDPDSYVKKLGPVAFKNFVQHNKKDVILFQIEVSLQESGSDANKRSALVSQIAETISKIDKTEDFTRQQDYIRQASQLLSIDESGFTNLVNKFIRNRISLEEKKLPFEEAKVHEENAKKAEANEFSDQTFELLYKDELQEKEIARILLEHGTKRKDDSQLMADYIISELPDDDLIDNQVVLKFIHEVRNMRDQEIVPDRNIFLYHPDAAISSLAVSLLHSPYEISPHWKREMGQSTGYQKSLFQQDYKSFLETLKPENEEKLQDFLKMQRDTSIDEVESAVNYLKLRKIKKMLLLNHADLEKSDAENMSNFIFTHIHLKNLEVELSRKIGSVVMR